MSRIKDKSHRQRGAQIVEFALVLPLLALLVCLIIEAATFIRIHQIVNNAAREGARVASVTEGSYYVDSGANKLGMAAACTYLNEHKSDLRGWGGGTCGEPVDVKVELVQSGDPDAIYIDGTYVPSTRAIVRYTFSPSYAPVFSLFHYVSTDINVQAKAQFRNFY